MVPALSDLDLRDLRALAMVARTRSLRDAAEVIAVSQTTVSRHIAGLETALGCPLVRRGWSGAELTQEGEIVARHAQAILDAVALCDAALPPVRRPPLLPRLRLRDLAAVAAILRVGSVSLAAAETGRSQPDLSRSLGHLRDACGSELFRRRASGMDPLPPAHLLTRLHGETTRQIAAIGPALAALAGEVTGRVAIGMLPFSGQALVPRAFAELTKRHPHLRLSAVPGSYPGLIEALRRHDIDRIIGPMRGPLLGPGLSETPLYDEAYTVVARAGHPLAQARTLDELTEAPWVVAPPGTPIRVWFEALFQRTGHLPPVQTCEMLSFSSAEEMLAASQSLGLLTYSDAAITRLRHDLTVIDLALPHPQIPIALTKLDTAPQDPALDAFETVLAGLLPGRS